MAGPGTDGIDAPTSAEEQDHRPVLNGGSRGRWRPPGLRIVIEESAAPAQDLVVVTDLDLGKTNEGLWCRQNTERAHGAKVGWVLARNGR
jgi:hypothetical protein